MRDGGRVTTKIEVGSELTIVNLAGSGIARFIRNTAVHHPIQSVFLIFHQSELLRTVSDNLQQIPAAGHQWPWFRLMPQFSFPQSQGGSDGRHDMLKIDPLTARLP